MGFIEVLRQAQDDRLLDVYTIFADQNQYSILLKYLYSLSVWACRRPFEESRRDPETPVRPSGRKFRVTRVLVNPLVRPAELVSASLIFILYHPPAPFKRWTG